MKKINKIQKQNAVEAYQQGKYILSSNWTYGSGRFTTRAAVPPYYTFVDIYGKNPELNKEGQANLERAIKKHPRAQKFLVCTNSKAILKLKKEIEA